MAGDCDECELEENVAEDRRGKKVTRWRGLLAPYGKPTGDKRRFANDALTARELPLPLRWQRVDTSGHQSSVVIGDTDGFEFVSGEGVYGVGTLFDPDPEVLPRLAEDVAEARLLLERKVIGPSVDLDDMQFHAIGTPEEIESLAAQGQRPEIEVTQGRISAATLVPIPAFAEARPFELFQVDAEEPDVDEPATAEEDQSNFAIFRRKGRKDSDGKPNNPGGKNQYGGPYGPAGSGGSSDAGRRSTSSSPASSRPASSPATRTSSTAAEGTADFDDWGRLANGSSSAEKAFDALPKDQQQALYDRVYDRAQALLDSDEGTSGEIMRQVLQALAFLNQLGTKHKLKTRRVETVDLDDDFAVQEDWDLPLAPMETDWRPDELDRPALVAGALVFSRAEDAGLFPLCAYLDGQLTLVPRAVFTAASILAGAEPTLPANVQARMRGVVSKIMERMGMSAPWSETEEADALLAAAGPLAPPRAWFEVPEPDRLTPLTITEDGQVYGHIAGSDIPHIGFAGEIIYPPKSATGYAYFHVGAVKTAEGDEIAVGKITMGGGHADLRLGFRAAAEHYDNSTRTAAIGRATDGQFGIWYCGALVPGLSDEQVAELRRSPVSGDWRRVGGSKELVAALAVNVPGFPIPRTQARVSGGREMALVAAGVVVPVGHEDATAAATEDDRIARIVQVTLDQQAQRSRRAAALVASLEGDAEAVNRTRAALAVQAFG